MRCLGRLVALGFVVGLLLLAGGCLLATRHVGPAFENGAYVYESDGQRREVRLSTEAARRFDAKMAGQLSAADLVGAATGGVPITEEELNSRLAEELAARGVTGVRHPFVRLTADGARAYATGDAGPLAVTVSSALNFSVQGGRVRVGFRDVHAGHLPVGAVVDRLIDRAGARDEIEQALTFVIPSHVTSIRVEEGRLRARLGIPLR